MSKPHITYHRLKELELSLLSDRDKSILHSLNKCRYLTTNHIQRLHFKDSVNPCAAARVTRRNLARLSEYGLIHNLERQIGTTRGNSRGGGGASVRLLSDAGKSLVHINNEAYIPRKRLYEPKSPFLKHALTVSEAYVQIIELCEKHGLNHIKTDFEPACWRGFTDENSRWVYLKPDLFTVVKNGKYEDRYFIEVDLGTEAPCIVLDKCRRYSYYYRLLAEQKDSDVFPLVVWQVPNVDRKARLQKHITKYSDLHHKNIFIVITPDEFEGLLRKGAGVAEAKGAA